MRFLHKDYGKIYYAGNNFNENQETLDQDHIKKTKNNNAHLILGSHHLLFLLNSFLYRSSIIVNLLWSI